MRANTEQTEDIFAPATITERIEFVRQEDRHRQARELGYFAAWANDLVQDQDQNLDELSKLNLLPTEREQLERLCELRRFWATEDRMLEDK